MILVSLDFDENLVRRYNRNPGEKVRQTHKIALADCGKVTQENVDVIFKGEGGAMMQHRTPGAKLFGVVRPKPYERKKL